MNKDSLLHYLIRSAIDPVKTPTGSQSLVILNHLRQMKLFGIRGGLELYPAQDDPMKARQSFIRRLWKENRLSTFLPRIWDLFIGEGNVLFLLRPNQRGFYDVRFWGGENYRSYYDMEGQLTKVVIVYQFKVDNKIGGGAYELKNSEQWLRLTITPDVISREYFDQSPGLDEQLHLEFSPSKETYQNWLGYIPCIECNNNSPGFGQRGYSDFLPLQDQIEALEYNYHAVNTNLNFFGGTTLVTTRSEGEVLEAAGDGSPALLNRITMAQRAGWESMGSYSAANAFPRHLNRFSMGMADKLRTKKVIGNVGGDERFSFLTPDPVTPDHNRFLREKREEIHFALGGIDELGISASASAYEMKTIYGKVAATATEKAEILYEYGLCKLFEMAVKAEERVFLEACAEMFKVLPDEVTPEFLQKKIDSGKFAMTPDFPGLAPLGDRTVKWRWTGDVFEESPRDILDKSIVVRNLQEQGVNSMEALNFLFPNKTDLEKEGMLSGGFPFRYINSIIGTLNQILGVFQNAMQLPNPEDPSLPLATAINVVPFLLQGMNTIQTELSYQKPNEPTSSDNPGIPNAPSGSGNPGSAPGTNPGGQPVGVQPRIPNAGIPTSPVSGLSAAGFSPFNPEFYPYSAGAGVQPAPGSDPNAAPGLLPDHAFGIPGEGTVIGGATIPAQPSSTQPVFIPNGLPDAAATAIWGTPQPDTTSGKSNGKSGGSKRKSK